MNSHTTDKFRKAIAELPTEVQQQARQAYRLFVENPYHPSLHLNPFIRRAQFTLHELDYIIVLLASWMKMTSSGIGLARTLNMTN